jgi:hypothetical protein
MGVLLRDFLTHQIFGLNGLVNLSNFAFLLGFSVRDYGPERSAEGHRDRLDPVPRPSETSLPRGKVFLGWAKTAGDDHCPEEQVWGRVGWERPRPHLGGDDAR